ncbi:MAG: DJ-1/PfpI family protein [Dehalococcoidia bacterium]
MTRNVAVVLFELAEELDFVGPWEVFSTVNYVEQGATNVFSVSEQGGTVRCANGLRVAVDHSLATCPAPDIIVVPGGRMDALVNSPAMVAWLKSASAKAELTSSVCTGAFGLAAAGLLEGKTATTWFGSRAILAKAHPAVTVVAERWVDQWPVITAQGVSAGIDMALYVVGRLWSPVTARKVQQLIEYFPAPPYQDVPMSEALFAAG